MPENRNNNGSLSLDNNRGTVCIDTYRVLDCCRDRDCFENTRIYLTATGEEVIQNATSVRTRSARTLWAYVGVDEMPFNNGFYRITVRYYILVECEACLGIGRSQNITGLAVLEKEVVLYGGVGNVVSYSSDKNNSYCNIGNPDTVTDNDPVAIVETVEPVVLDTKIDCECNPCCQKNDFAEVPDLIRQQMDGELILTSNTPHLYITFGIFSVIRIQRPAQLLVQATDYSVPDKECPGASTDTPCELFRSMPFPTNQFGIIRPQGNTDNRPPRSCGCSGRNPG